MPEMPVEPTAGELGERNLARSTRSPRPSRSGRCSRSRIVLGSVSNPHRRRLQRRPGVLLAGLGVLAIGYALSLFARRYAGAGAVYEYLTHGAHPAVGIFAAGIFFVGTLFLGGGGIYLGLGILTQGFWVDAHRRRSAPAWWVFALIFLVARARPQLHRRPARDRRDADVRGDLVHPDADPRPSRSSPGRRRRQHARRCSTRPTTSTRRRRVSAASCSASCCSSGSRQPPRSARRARSAPLDSARRARHGRGVGGVLRAHGLRDLDRLGGKAAVEKGAWALDPAALDKLATQYVGSWLAHDHRPRRDPRRDRARARDLRDASAAATSRSAATACCRRCSRRRRATTRRGSAT